MDAPRVTARIGLLITALSLLPGLALARGAFDDRLPQEPSEELSPNEQRAHDYVSSVNDSVLSASAMTDSLIASQSGIAQYQDYSQPYASTVLTTPTAASQYESSSLQTTASFEQPPVTDYSSGENAWNKQEDIKPTTALINVDTENNTNIGADQDFAENTSRIESPPSETPVSSWDLPSAVTQEQYESAIGTAFFIEPAESNQQNTPVPKIKDRRDDDEKNPAPLTIETHTQEEVRDTAKTVTPDTSFYYPDIPSQEHNTETTE